MSEEAVPTLEEDLFKMIKEIEAVAEKLKKPIYEVIPLLAHRELVIINQQLKAIHEHLDMIEERTRKREVSK